MSHKILGMALLGTLPFAGHAANLAVERMIITGGSVNVFGSNYGIAGCGSSLDWACLSPGPAAQIDDGISNDGAMVAGGLWGDLANPVVSAMFVDSLLLGYFAHSGGIGVPADPDPDGLTAVIDTETGTIIADFSGFYWHWDGTIIFAGGTATGQISPVAISPGGAGHYSFLLSWTAPGYGSIFNPPTYHMNLAGTLVTAVPEAETYALMLTGLGLIGLSAWRRQGTR